MWTPDHHARTWDFRKLLPHNSVYSVALRFPFKGLSSSVFQHENAPVCIMSSMKTLFSNIGVEDLE